MDTNLLAIESSINHSVEVWVYRTNIIYNLRKREKGCVCETEGEYRGILPINITFIYKKIPN